MKFDELSPELQSKARKRKTPEEVLALAREEGYEVTDEELQAISGGVKWSLWCTIRPATRSARWITPKGS